MTLPESMTLTENLPTTIFSVKLMHLCTIDTVNEGKEGKIVLVSAPVRIKNSLFKNLGFAQIELAGLSM